MTTQRKKLKGNIQNTTEEMDLLNQLQSLSWCKPDWGYPSIDNLDKELLRKSNELTTTKCSDDIDDIIRRSKAFPATIPIMSVRLETLRITRLEDRLKRNITSTYTLLHERVLCLMSKFLSFKRQYGSDIEKALYKDMSVALLIDRILKKRAVSFLTARDKYKLLTGEIGSDGWEAVGTPDERPPLILENCLSYDEMKLSAMVYVSGYTECINEGSRKNVGLVCDTDIEQEAVVIGIIGARFKRERRMDWEDILITAKQNTIENGYGERGSELSAKRQWRKMWSEFYEVPNYTYEELKSSVTVYNKAKDKMYTERFVRIGPDVLFDNEAYYKRMVVLVESTLLEADARGASAGRSVYLNIIGAGLGVWRASRHQEDLYVLAFVERTRALMECGLLDRVADVNFAYIKPSRYVITLFKDKTECETRPVRKLFIENKQHRLGGINVQLESREPSSKLADEHAGKLLVITYPWDGNAHPGNEFWLGKLSSSGDPAAACCTQVAELHNAHVNPAVGGHNVRVATRTGVTTLRDCCIALSSP